MVKKSIPYRWNSEINYAILYHSFSLKFSESLNREVICHSDKTYYHETNIWLVGGVTMRELMLCRKIDMDDRCTWYIFYYHSLLVYSEMIMTKKLLDMHNRYLSSTTFRVQHSKMPTSHVTTTHSGR